jgi:hypothetical protein
MDNSEVHKQEEMFLMKIQLNPLKDIINESQKIAVK